MEEVPLSLETTRPEELPGYEKENAKPARKIVTGPPRLNFNRAKASQKKKVNRVFQNNNQTETQLPKNEKQSPKNETPIQKNEKKLKEEIKKGQKKLSIPTNEEILKAILPDPILEILPSIQKYCNPIESLTIEKNQVTFKFRHPGGGK